MTRNHARLAQLQAALFAYVTGLGEEPEGLSSQIDTRGSATLRLGVYRGSYRARLQEYLGSKFLRLQTLLGQAGFDALVANYAVSCPSATPSLLDFAAGLPAFMASRPDLAPPAAVELARLEQARAVAAEAAAPEPSRAMPTPLPDEPLRVIPSLATIRLSWDAFVAFQTPMPTMEPTPAAGAVWRAGLTVVHCGLAFEEVQAIEAATAGQALSEVATLAQTTPEALLERWTTKGWLLR